MSSTTLWLCTSAFQHRTKSSHEFQVLVEGPSAKSELAVPRHSTPLSIVSLTSIVIAKLPRASGTAALKKQWESAEVDSKWTNGSFAKRLEKSARRKQLSDFERFKVTRLRKQVSLRAG
jgi:large subunit ribosomal protein L14e